MTCTKEFPLISIGISWGIHIEEIIEEPPKPDGMVDLLLKTKLFRNFFDCLEFGKDARTEATEVSRKISQQHGPSCYMVGRPMHNIAKKSEGAIVFTNADKQTPPFLHNRPLYVEAKINGLKIKHVLVDNGASINLMPLGIYSAIKEVRGGSSRN